MWKGATVTDSLNIAKDHPTVLYSRNRGPTFLCTHERVMAMIAKHWFFLSRVFEAN